MARFDYLKKNHQYLDLFALFKRWPTKVAHAPQHVTIKVPANTLVWADDIKTPVKKKRGPGEY